MYIYGVEGRNKVKKVILFLLVGFFAFSLVACGDDGELDKTNKDDIPTCETNEVYMDGECKIPTPDQIDFALENALTFELTGYDLEYHYYIIQLLPIDSFGGTYKIEYYRVDEETTYLEEGVYTQNLGYDLERDDHPNGDRPVWSFRSNGAGIYLYSVTHVESTDDGAQTVYDTYSEMSFDLVID